MVISVGVLEVGSNEDVREGQHEHTKKHDEHGDDPSEKCGRVLVAIAYGGDGRDDKPEGVWD